MNAQFYAAHGARIVMNWAADLVLRRHFGQRRGAGAHL